MTTGEDWAFRDLQDRTLELMGAAQDLSRDTGAPILHRAMAVKLYDELEKHCCPLVSMFDVDPQDPYYTDPASALAAEIAEVEQGGTR